MEIILTVLITLGVCTLVYVFMGVVRLNGRVDNLEVARLDIDDELRKLRKELEDDIEYLHKEMSSKEVQQQSNLDRRLDNIWSEIHKLTNKEKS